jgi:hypothetical protein
MPRDEDPYRPTEEDTKQEAAEEAEDDVVFASRADEDETDTKAERRKSKRITAKAKKVADDGEAANEGVTDESTAAAEQDLESSPKEKLESAPTATQTRKRKARLSSPTKAATSAEPVVQREEDEIIAEPRETRSSKRRAGAMEDEPDSSKQEVLEASTEDESEKPKKRSKRSSGWSLTSFWKKKN